MQVNRLNEQIVELQSHQMVLEKIVEQADADERETYHILAEEYNQIKADNERLEKQLHKFYEKIGEVDYLSGLVTKYKEVPLPSRRSFCHPSRPSPSRRSRTSSSSLSLCKKRLSASSPKRRTNFSK